MKVFKDIRDFLIFEVAVTNKCRFFRDANIEEFLDAISETAVSRTESIKAGTVLWRAQLGVQPVGDDYRWRPFEKKRMMPRTDLATEGRANPVGIPVLYCATEPDTALAEVRPNLASTLSLAKLITQRDLVVVDCSKNISEKSLFDILNGEDLPTPSELEPIIWNQINEAFTKPVDRTDDEARYASTQVIAELFKRKGYGGIKYQSGYGPSGHNLALFDIKCASVDEVYVRGVKSIEIKFS